MIGAADPSGSIMPGISVITTHPGGARHLSQPGEVAWNAKGYGMNAVYAIPVTATA